MTESTEPRRCGMPTREGRPCRARAVVGADGCVQHDERAAEITAERAAQSRLDADRAEREWRRRLTALRREAGRIVSALDGCTPCSRALLLDLLLTAPTDEDTGDTPTDRGWQRVVEHIRHGHDEHTPTRSTDA